MGIEDELVGNRHREAAEVVAESPETDNPPQAASKPELRVPPGLQRGSHKTREQWLESALFAVDLLRRTMGRDDLSGVELLDVGCGTKIVKTLLDRSMPIGHYAGIDAASPVIDWLRANVTDPRFEFHHLDAHNAMYNPAGKPLESFDLLPVGPRRFDLISLFSVFTHLAPHDFAAMLRLLRRHVKADGFLLFSLFLRDPEQPSPYSRALRERLNSADPEVRARMAAAIERASRRPPAEEDRRWVDEVPARPLLRARYQRDYAVELVDGTGWRIEAVHPPERYIQHYMVCRPV
jgi:SAM-dependent methyltransferase